MGKFNLTTMNTDTTAAVDSVSDLRLKMAEHVLTQYSCFGSTDVRNILIETKAGVWRRSESDLIRRLRLIFSAAE